MIAPRPAIVVAPTEPEPVESRARSGPFVVAGIVVAALVVAVLLRPRPQAPVVSVPVVVEPKPAPPVAAPAPVAAPVVVAAPVPAYDGSLKLGLRRFVDGDAWSLRLLLIDDANTPTVVTIASGNGAAVEGAIAPEPDFARGNRDPGVVFKDADVTVERRPTDLVVRRGAGENVVAHVTEATALRAAPFARARYEK